MHHVPTKPLISDLNSVVEQVNSLKKNHESIAERNTILGNQLIMLYGSVDFAQRKQGLLSLLPFYSVSIPSLVDTDTALCEEKAHKSPDQYLWVPRGHKIEAMERA